MPPQQYIARLEDKTKHSEKYTQYHFELVSPHSMEFMAGQYVSIKVTDQGERRSYSICSNPSITHGFDLLIDSTPQGKGVTYLQSLAFGAEIQLLGPLGQFCISDYQRQRPIVLIGTGSGIAPLKSMMLGLLQDNHYSGEVYLYWGERYAQDLLWLEEMNDFSQAFANFHFVPVLSKAPDEWTLSRGRVTDVLSVVDMPTGAECYLCGNASMIHDVSAVLQTRGVPAGAIFHEKFY